LAQSFVSDLPKLAASWTASEKNTISTSQVNCILVAYEFPSGVLRWMDCSTVMLHSRSMGICRAAFPSTTCLLLSTTTRQLVHGSCSSIIEVRWKIGLFAPRLVFAIEPLVPSSRTRSGSVIPDGVRSIDSRIKTVRKVTQTMLRTFQVYKTGRTSLSIFPQQHLQSAPDPQNF
jgi:hypothetical protein